MALVDFVEESARDNGWSTMPLAQLCAEIIQRHHAYLRDVLPRLSNRTASAAAQSPEYAEVARIFSGFRMDLEAHMAKEETTFFPQMANLERNLSSNGALRPSVAGPIGFLEAEHEEAISSLAAMERLTLRFHASRGCRQRRAPAAGRARHPERGHALARPQGERRPFPPRPRPRTLPDRRGAGDRWWELSTTETQRHGEIRRASERIILSEERAKNLDVILWGNVEISSFGSE